jgi:hypothetical protein
MSVVRPVPYNIQVGEYIDASAITKNFIQLVEDINANVLAAGGNPSQPFFVAPAVDPGQAVNLGQANSLYAPAGNYAALNGDPAQVFAVANATSSTQAVNLSQLGSYNQVIASFATGTLPSTCWGGAVQVQQNATATIPTTNPPAGSKVVLFGFGGPFSVASNSNQYIYSPALGLTPSSGPTTVTVSDGGWIELTSRGNGEYDITGGSLLVFQSVAPVFTQPVSVPNAVSNGQAVNLGQVQTLIGNSGSSLPVTQPISSLPANYDTNQVVLLATSTPTTGVSFSASDSRVLSVGEGPNGPFVRANTNPLDLTSNSGVLVPNAVTSAHALNLGQADSRYQQRNLIVEAGAAGTLTSNAYIGVYVNAIQVNGSGVAVTLPGNCVGSYAVATATATATQTINVLKKAVGSTTLTTVGTITFAAGASSGTFSTTSSAAVTFNPGEAMYVQVGSTADTTLANVAISLFLTY